MASHSLKKLRKEHHNLRKERKQQNEQDHQKEKWRRRDLSYPWTLESSLDDKEIHANWGRNLSHLDDDDQEAPNHTLS